MVFINAALLWGPALVSVPIIIYLLQRRKVKIVEWAAMQFLLDVMEEQKKITLEELLLLLLRCLMILFLALAVCRPVLQGAAGSLFGGSCDTILLMDASYSMAVRSGAQNRWSIAQEKANDVLKTQTSTSGVSLVLGSARPITLVGDFSPDHELLAETIKHLEASDLAGGVQPSLREAMTLFKSSRKPAKHLFVISDFQAREWSVPEKEILDSIKQLSTNDCKISFVPIFDSQLPNLSASELTLLAGGARVGAPCRFSGKIFNHGPEPVTDIAVDFLIDGRVIESSTVSVMPSQSAQLLFPYTAMEEGPHSATLKIREDLLPADNECNLAFVAADAIPILAVLDNVDQVDDARPTDFFELALNPFIDKSESPEALYRVKHVDASDLPAESLEEYAVVCIAGTAGLTSGEAKQLEAYVRKGGGVLMFLGDTTNIMSYNENLHRKGEGLFPWSIFPEKIEASDKDAPLAFLPQLPEHPIWVPLFGKKTDYFTLVRFYNAFGFEKADLSNVAIMANVRTDEGKEYPFILDIKRGRGHAVVVGTSMTPKMNNWVAHTSFVTFVNQAVLYLRSFKSGGSQVQVGDSLRRYVGFQQSEATYSLTSPSNDTAAVSVMKEEDEYVLKLPQFLESGFYRLQNQDDQSDRILISANVDPREGEIKAMTPDELKAVYGEHGVTVHGLDEDEEEDESALEFAALLLILMLLCWLGENLLAYRISKR